VFVKVVEYLNTLCLMLHMADTPASFFGQTIFKSFFLIYSTSCLVLNKDWTLELS